MSGGGGGEVSIVGSVKVSPTLMLLSSSMMQATGLLGSKCYLCTGPTFGEKVRRIPPSWLIVWFGES